MITIETLKTMNDEQINVLNQIADTVVDAANKLVDNGIFAENKGEIEIRLWSALYGTEDVAEINEINFWLDQHKGQKSNARRM